MKLQHLVTVFLSLCTPEGFLLYKILAVPSDSPKFSSSDTSGTKSPSHTLFPPHPYHQENRNLPLSPLYTTSPFSSCVTSGAKSYFRAHFVPHLILQEEKHPPRHFAVLMCHIRKWEKQNNGLFSLLGPENRSKRIFLTNIQ